MLYFERDIKFSKEGDIEFLDGDFKITQDTESLEQDIHNRVKTNNPDWYLHEKIGADLEDLRGKPNTQETGTEGEEKIANSLFYGDRINPGDLEVKAVPTKRNEITYYTFIKTGMGKPLLKPIKVSLD